MNLIIVSCESEFHLHGIDHCKKDYIERFGINNSEFFK